MRKFIGFIGGTTAGIAAIMFLGLFTVGFNANLIAALPGAAIIAAAGAMMMVSSDENNDISIRKAAAFGTASFAIFTVVIYLAVTLYFNSWTVAGVLAELLPNLLRLAFFAALGGAVGAGYAGSAALIGTSNSKSAA